LLGPGLLASSLAALLPVTDALAQAVSFSPATDYVVGTHPASVAIADLNGDGRPDLATANVFSDNVSILLGTGAGVFGAATNFAVGPNPTSVAIADLNSDDQPDLAVANRNCGCVSILLGTGTGAFGAVANFNAGPARLFDVAIADLNGDGHPDLAVTNDGIVNTVSILLGNGTGAFGPPTNIAGDLSYSVAIADLNGDGNPDLALANAPSNAVSILLNTTPPASTTPSFSAATNFAVGTGPLSVEIADLNGDGKPDLAVGNNLSDDVSILLNTTPPASTAPSFSAANFHAGVLPASLAIGDLNADSKPDLAVVTQNNAVSILLGTGGGAFGPATDFAVGTHPLSVAIGDLNADGRPDLAVTNRAANTVSVLLNTTPFMDCDVDGVPDINEGTTVKNFCVLCTSVPCSNGTTWPLEVQWGAGIYPNANCPGVPITPSDANDMANGLVSCINDTTCPTIHATVTNPGPFVTCFRLVGPMVSAAANANVCVGNPICCAALFDPSGCQFNPELFQVSMGRDCNGNRVDDAIDILEGTSLDADGNGMPDECDVIPTVSAWGLVVLALLLLTGAKIYFARRQTATA